MTLKNHPYQKLDPKSIEQFVTHLRAANDPVPINATQITGLACPLSFLPGWDLIDLTLQDSDQSVHAYFIAQGPSVHLIDFNPAHLQTMVHGIGPTLTGDTIADYVRFFFFFAHAPHGRLRLIESTDDFPWSDEPGPSAMKALSRIVQELEFQHAVPVGSWQGAASFLQGRSLFSGRILVHPNGAIDLMDQRLEVDHLPVLDDAA